MKEKKIEYILGSGERIKRIRLYADEGKALTNDEGQTVWNCIDVDSVDGWQEVDEVSDLNGGIISIGR